MRRTILCALLGALAAMGSAVAVADGTPAPLALVTAASNHLLIPGVAADSPPPLQTCDPNDFTSGFQFQGLHWAEIPSFTGQVFAGVIVSRCTKAISDVSVAATLFDATGSPSSTVLFHPTFGLLPPGGASPFFVIVPPGEATVSAMAFAVLRYTVIQDTTPLLQLTEGPISRDAAGAT